MSGPSVEEIFGSTHNNERHIHTLRTCPEPRVGARLAVYVRAGVLSVSCDFCVCLGLAFMFRARRSVGGGGLRNSIYYGASKCAAVTQHSERQLQSPHHPFIASTTTEKGLQTEMPRSRSRSYSRSPLRSPARSPVRSDRGRSASPLSPRSRSPSRSRSRSRSASYSSRGSRSPSPPPNPLADACPFLIRVFVLRNKHNPVIEYDQKRLPSEEYRVYAW